MPGFSFVSLSQGIGLMHKAKQNLNWLEIGWKQIVSKYSWRHLAEWSIFESTREQGEKFVELLFLNLKIGNSENDKRLLTTGFSLPPGVGNQASVVTDYFIIPMPGFDVDGLAHRSQTFQRRFVIFVCPVISIFYQQSEGCGRQIKLIYFESLHCWPIAARIRINRCWFKQNTCASIAEGTINNITMS